MVKLIKKIFLLILIPSFSFVFIQSCAEDPDPSLFELIDPDTPTPVISSIEPLGQAVSGVTVVTINGSNFSDNESHFVVSFNGVPGVILEATPTLLRVRVPNVIADSVAVRVSKIDAEPFSNLFQYRLTPALAEIKKDAGGSNLFSEDIVPYGLTTDAQGNIYTSLVEFNIGKGIKKISPAGEIVPNGLLVDFAPKGGETSFHRLNMYQNTTIIGARRVKAIFQITQGVAASPFASTGLNDSYDIDFDQNLNIWVGGLGLFRVTPSKQIKSFGFTGTIKAVRVFENFLYVLATVDVGDVIRRFPIISSDSLGSAEDVINISESVLPDTGIVKITASDFDIAADGDIIVGITKNSTPIIIVHQDGSFETLYPGVVPNGTRIYAFDWDSGNYLYFTREASGNLIQTIFRLNMQKLGAPHYGR